MHLQLKISYIPYKYEHQHIYNLSYHQNRDTTADRDMYLITKVLRSTRNNNAFMFTARKAWQTVQVMLKR